MKRRTNKRKNERKNKTKKRTKRTKKRKTTCMCPVTKNSCKLSNRWGKFESDKLAHRLVRKHASATGKPSSSMRSQPVEFESSSAWRTWKQLQRGVLLSTTSITVGAALDQILLLVYYLLLLFLPLSYHFISIIMLLLTLLWSALLPMLSLQSITLIIIGIIIKNRSSWKLKFNELKLVGEFWTISVDQPSVLLIFCCLIFSRQRNAKLTQAKLNAFKHLHPWTLHAQLFVCTMCCLCLRLRGSWPPDWGHTKAS